jgi:hypothetical protein
MKATKILFALAVVLMLAPHTFASCPNRSRSVSPGPQIGSGWYNTFDVGCASTDAITGWMTCYDWIGNFFAPGTYAYYSMVVSAGAAHTGWYVTTWVDFVDYYANSMNGMAVGVRVWHNGSISYANTFFFHNGSQGSLSCYRIDSTSFSVEEGDTVEVYYSVDNYNNATIKIAPPVIFEG